MKQTLLTKLVPDAVQHASLSRTRDAFNDACNWIAGIAFAQQCANMVPDAAPVVAPGTSPRH